MCEREKPWLYYYMLSSLQVEHLNPDAVQFTLVYIVIHLLYLLIGKEKTIVWTNIIFHFFELVFRRTNLKTQKKSIDIFNNFPAFSLRDEAWGFLGIIGENVQKIDVRGVIKWWLFNAPFHYNVLLYNCITGTLAVSNEVEMSLVALRVSPSSMARCLTNPKLVKRWTSWLD